MAQKRSKAPTEVHYPEDVIAEAAARKARIKSDQQFLRDLARPTADSANTVVDGFVVETGQPQQPVKLLTNWREITDSLGLPHGDREKVKSLNERYNGPIPAVAKGSQPIVTYGDLIEWWNRLAAMQQDLAGQRSGKTLSAQSHKYGRSGNVVPEINGSVKDRRTKR